MASPRPDHHWPAPLGIVGDGDHRIRPVEGEVGVALREVHFDVVSGELVHVAVAVLVVLQGRGRRGVRFHVGLAVAAAGGVVQVVGDHPIGEHVLERRAEGRQVCVDTGDAIGGLLQ